MKLLSWNCRGFAWAAAIQKFKGLLRDVNPDCIFLSKTKIPKRKISPLLTQLGFVNIVYINPIRKAGGLCFAWKNGLDIEPLYSNNNLINVIIFSDPPNTPWMLSLVYGPPYSSLKANFWNNLETTLNSFGGAWVGIGDFNCILSQSEKQGGRPFALSSNGGFSGFITNNGLIDLGF